MQQAGGRTESGGRRQTSGYYREEFGRIARFYDFGIRNAFRLAGGERRFRGAIVEAARVEPGQKILDVSCGTGTLAAMLAAAAGAEGQVTGIDLSDEMLAVGRRKHPGVEFIRANAEDLPFASETFDRVTMSLAIHEMVREGRKNALAEMRRVLKTGGLAVIADMRPPDTRINRLGAKFVGLVETRTLTDLWSQGLYYELGQASFGERRRHITGRGFFEVVAGEKT